MVCHNLNKSVISVDICTKGTNGEHACSFVFCTAASLIGILPFFLRLSCDFPSLKVTARLFQYIPAFSLIFASFCRVKMHSTFCYMLKHSGFHFFLTLSFKQFNFLKETFELYQHGLSKLVVKPLRVIILVGDRDLQRKSLTSSNKPFSLNSTLWVDLFCLMVNVAAATQTLVKRVCVTQQHRTRTPFIINEVKEKSEVFPRPYFFPRML